MTARNEDQNFMQWLRELQSRVSQLEMSSGVKQNNIRLGDWVVDIDVDGCVVATNIKTDEQRVICHDNCAECVDEFSIVSIGTSTAPLGIANDGKSIYANGATSNSMARINSETGVVTNIALLFATDPDGIYFDGTYIWTSNFSSNNLNRFHPSDNAQFFVSLGANHGPLNSVMVKGQLYVTCFNTDNVVQIDIASSTVITTFSVGASGGPDGIVYDPSTGCLFIACSGSSKLAKLDLSSGTFPDIISVPGNPKSLCMRGSDVWVSGYTSNSVSIVNASSMAILNTYPVPGDGGPDGTFFDGVHVWTANTSSFTRWGLDGSSKSYPTPAGTIRPSTITKLNGSLWITNFGSNNVTKATLCTEGSGPLAPTLPEL